MTIERGTEQIRMLDHALALASRGWAVIALHPGGKVPYAGASWPAYATTAEEAIRATWKRHPTANAGIATGPASGFWALDADGVAGLASLRKLIAERGSLPRTLVVRTGHGLHYYWLLPDVRIGNRTDIAWTGSHLDARGEGGYVVAPGSLHRATGRQYRILIDEPMALAPAWLIDLVARATPVACAEASEPIATQGLDPLQAAALESAIRRLREAQRPSGRPGSPEYVAGARNATLNREAHGLARTRAPREVVESALCAAAIEAGLSEHATRRTFESGWRAGMRATPLARRSPRARA